MSGYTFPEPKSSTLGTVRPCGLTRRELRNLRKLFGVLKPHKARRELLERTKNVAYAFPWEPARRLAVSYADAIKRCKPKPARRFRVDGGVCSYTI